MTITVNTPDGGQAQFPDGTPTSAMTSALQAKFGGPSAASAQPSDTDYSNSPFSAAGRTFAESAGLGAGDLITSHLMGTSLAHEQAKTAAAAASLPWYVRYPTEAAGYTLGAGALLSGIPEELGIGGVGAMALEGGLAGGASAALHSDDPSLGGVLTGAAGGAALGGAAGGLVKGINPALKVLGKAGKVDPIAAQAQTTAASDALYAQMHQTPVNPTAVSRPINRAMPAPNSSMETGMSPGLRNQISDIQTALQNHQNLGTQPTLGDVNSWKRQINEAASTSVDGKIAGQMSAGLDGVMNAQAPDLNQAAQTAYQKSAMAENLAKWQRQVQTGGNVGQAPFTEAERFYDPSSPEYQTVAGLANQGGGHSFTTSALGHLGANALGAIGGAIGGFPGAFAGEAGGYLFARPAIYKAMKNYDTRQKLKAFQQAYPQMTGVPLTGGRQAPQMSGQQSNQVGEQLKNLMLGMAY